MPASTRLQCEEWRFASPAPHDTAAHEPFRSCQHAAGDTTLYLMLGRDDYVVWVGRTWRPLEGQQAAYDQLSRTLKEAHGPAHLCPREDAASVWEHRRWQKPGYSLGVARVDRDHLTLNWTLGPIICHTG